MLGRAKFFFKFLRDKGETIERHYRCTPLVLWHSKNRPLVMGADSKLMEDIERAGILSEMERKRFVGVAQDLVLHAKSLRPNSAADLLSCLKALGEKDVLHQFLTSDIANYIESERFRDQLLSLSETVGLEAIKPTLLTVIPQMPCIPEAPVPRPYTFKTSLLT